MDTQSHSPVLQPTAADALPSCSAHHRLAVSSSRHISSVITQPDEKFKLHSEGKHNDPVRMVSIN